MSRNDLHDYINELADKVKYFNEGIRQSRFVEDEEIDLLAKYVHALQKQITALRKEADDAAPQANASTDEPAAESHTSSQEEETIRNTKELTQQESQEKSTQKETSEENNSAREGDEESRANNEYPASSTNHSHPGVITDETEKNEQEEMPEEAKEVEQSVEGKAETSQNKDQILSDEEAKEDTSSLTDENGKEAHPSDDIPQSTTKAAPTTEGEGELHSQASTGNEKIPESQTDEQQDEARSAPENQKQDVDEEEKEDVPDYIKQLLANKEERDQSWEELEQEADDYGGQSYVQKIRELKRKANLNPEKPTLNEQLKQDKPELSQQIKRHVQDIRQAIGVNDRFLFITELFNGDTESYNQTIDELKKLRTRAQAEQYVKEKLEPMRGWQENPRIAEKMNDLIVRRFEQ